MKGFISYVICLHAFLLKGIAGFATPKSEFILEIDGNGITTSREHICVIEQKHGNAIGGRAKCWGFDVMGKLDAPTDVS
jgi:hypothetical protein